MKKTAIIVALGVAVVAWGIPSTSYADNGRDFRGGRRGTHQAAGHPERQEKDREDKRPVIIVPTGGGISGPLGRTCAEARERMRWSDLPCAPGMPEK